MSQDSISIWELGKSLPDFMSIVKLSEVFEVSADYLLGLSDY
jgi:transcriptional regulator with XRE-family HTH domain